LHARHWRHTGHYLRVDLHTRLPGTWTPERDVWEVLRPHTVQMLIGGYAGLVLDPPASALLCALHRAHHPLSFEKPSADLQRAVERLDLATWRVANQLAGRLEATEAFTSGLRLSPGGSRLADRLGLAHSLPPIRRLTASGAAGAALLEWLSGPAQSRERVHLVLRGVFPTPHTMRSFHPLARRGKPGLALAYVLRPAVVAAKAPGAVREWRRAQGRW
jgi:hypothetical protein